MKLTPVRIAVPAVLLATAVGVLFFSSRGSAGGPRDVATPGTSEGEPLPWLAMSSDTPPPVRAAAGWPFQQLPLIAKFDIPAPQLTIPQFSLLTPPSRLVVLPFPVPAPPPPPVASALSPWLLAPLAAGAAVGSAEAEGVGTVIPEPSTMLLLSTGLMLLGLGAKRRRA